MRPATVSAEAGLRLQHVDKAVEVGRNRNADGPARWKLDVEDQARSPKCDRRALADQRPNGGVALVPNGEISALHNLRGGINVLVLAGQVDPKQKTAHLGPDLSIFELVLAEAFRVIDAAAGANLQDGAFVQLGALEAAAGTRAVARAR